MNFTKEEKIVLFTIAAGILAGVLITLFVHIPQKPMAAAVASAESQPVNINTATADELSRLPGIGETFAARIIEYRVSHSGFKNIEELRNVKGIGEKKFEKIKRFVVLE